MSADFLTTPHEFPRGRRFSADEIRRQPEFRAIIASSTEKDGNKHASNSNQTTTKSKPIMNTPSFNVAENSKPKLLRARSNTIPSTEVPLTTREISKETGNSTCLLSPRDIDYKSGTQHVRNIAYSIPYDETQNEEQCVILKKDDDMGISVGKKLGSPPRPKKAWCDPEEHTASRIVCHKASLKKRNSISRDKHSSEIMSTVYEESLTGEQHNKMTMSPPVKKDELNNLSIGPLSKGELNALYDVSSKNSCDDDYAENADNALRQIQSAPAGTFVTDDLDHDKESTASTTQESHTQSRKAINSIHFQTNIEDTQQPECKEIDDKSKLFSRQVSTSSFRKYDAKLEKSAVYLRSRSRNFTRATQFMTAPKSGIRQLNVHYSQTNSCHNDRIIFTDLLKNSHIQNAVVADGVFAMERRLYNRRHEKGKSTTFYDRFIPPSTRNSKQRPHSSPLAGSPRSKSEARTVADKKKERKDRIHKKDEFIEFGYVPRVTTLEIQGPEAIEDILMSCRYLRVTPNKQPWLYSNDE